MFFKILLSLLICGVALANANSYEGYKIYDVTAKNYFEKGVLLRFAENERYDFFALPKLLTEAARVMVHPDDQFDFEATLKKYGLVYTIINENVGESIALERAQNAMRRSMPQTSARIDFKSYPRHAEINAYLADMAKKYPNRVSVQTIGRSYENRELKTITITNGDGKKNKKIIFVDAGIHAREWIAPISALKFVQELVENDKQNSALLATYDWIILPVANPDGYEYTHTTSRMWRKTRKPSSTQCTGTDGNRNFDFHWGEVGASSVPCSDTFRGPTAFSEPETKAIRDILLSRGDSIKMYLTLHSYGRYMLYPWGYTSNLPDTWQNLDRVAQAGAAAIKSYNNARYTVGSSTNVLYAAAGGSDDYAFAKAKIPISITMELPAGGSGFDPSPAQIQPYVQETWVGTKAMALDVIAHY